MKNTLELAALKEPKEMVLKQVKESAVTSFLLTNKRAVVLIALGSVILLSILAYLLIKLLLKCKNEKVIKLMQKLEKILLFSMLLRTILATFL